MMLDDYRGLYRKEKDLDYVTPISRKKKETIKNKEEVKTRIHQLRISSFAEKILIVASNHKSFTIDDIVEESKAQPNNVRIVLYNTYPIADI